MPIRPLKILFLPYLLFVALIAVACVGRGVATLAPTPIPTPGPTATPVATPAPIPIPTSLPATTPTMPEIPRWLQRAASAGGGPCRTRNRFSSGTSPTIASRLSVLHGRPSYFQPYRRRQRQGQPCPLSPDGEQRLQPGNTLLRVHSRPAGRRNRERSRLRAISAFKSP